MDQLGIGIKLIKNLFKKEEKEEKTFKIKYKLTIIK